MLAYKTVWMVGASFASSCLAGLYASLVPTVAYHYEDIAALIMILGKVPDQGRLY
jgi:hypothetical protein